MSVKVIFVQVQTKSTKRCSASDSVDSEHVGLSKVEAAVLCRGFNSAVERIKK